jgi:hypothetical protein
MLISIPQRFLTKVRGKQTVPALDLRGSALCTINKNTQEFASFAYVQSPVDACRLPKLSALVSSPAPIVER